MTTLTLIRHGITEWNKQGRYCGSKDIGLSNLGRLQAKRLAKKIKLNGFDKIYSSCRKRSLQTARILFGKEKIIKVNALREIHFGKLEGLRHKEILKVYGKDYQKWIEDPYCNNVLGVESMAAFKKRVSTSLRNIAKVNPGKNLAIVCHGGVIAIFISGIIKDRNFWRHVPPAASVTVIEYNRRKFALRRNG